MQATLYEVTLAIGAVAGVLLTLSSVGGRAKTALEWLLKPVLAHRRRTEAQLAKISVFMEEVSHELKPNNGTSMRDTVNRIENRQVVFEQRQRAILTDAQVGVFETDAVGSIIWVNRKLCRLMARTPDELLGFGWFNCMVANERDSAHEAWEEAVKEGREFHRDIKVLTPDNTAIPLQVRCIRMTDKEDRIAGFIGFVITRQQATCPCEPPIV